MRKRILLLSIYALPFTCTAQILINLQLPPSGLTVKNQLWNFSLINTGADNLSVQVEVVLRDVSKNQQVLTGTSKSFTISKGIKQVQYADVMPVTYNVNNSGYGIDASPDGFLPIGVFSICFSVIQTVNDATETVAEECETVEIEPLSPPMLVTPADSEHVEMTRPFFSWTPPVPFNLFNNLLYDFTLVEVQSTQTGAVAVQQNFPLLSQTGLTVTNFQYPLTSPELDTSKTYAWQVTAKNNSSAIGNSEVWTFRVNKFGIDSSINVPVGFYVKLNNTTEPAYAICEGVVRYEYLNELNDSTATLKLFDISMASMQEITPENSQPVLKYGQNFLKWDLTNVSGITTNHIYLLELTNSKNEKWNMKFEYHQPNQ
jgi:hypothetical protein